MRATPGISCSGEAGVVEINNGTIGQRRYLRAARAYLGSGNPLAGEALNICDGAAEKIRLVRDGVVKVDLSINTSPLRLDFIDTDHGSVVPLSVYLDGTAQTKIPQLVISETVAPAAPASGCVLYVDSTTHALMARFSTGSPVTIAAHP